MACALLLPETDANANFKQLYILIQNELVDEQTTLGKKLSFSGGLFNWSVKKKKMVI